MNLESTFAFVICFIIPLLHLGSSECSVDICQWERWASWSADCICGVPVFNRFKSRAFCCDTNWGSQECMNICGLNADHVFESESCVVCYNGGYWNYAECQCNKRYYGKCCEYRVNMCEAVPADVVFVLDSSVSQTEGQFKKQLEFVERFVDTVGVSSSSFQIAVVTFSTEAHTEIDYDHRMTKDAIKNKIRSVRFRPGATFTDKGLALARNMLQSRGNRLSGLNIEKFTFVLTDGMSTDRRSTKREAMYLRSLSTVVVVGIGQMVSHEELQIIASPADQFTQSYVFSVENFDSLHTLIDRLIDATCGKCSTSSRTDIIALIDDHSSSAMTTTEFSLALNGITYILQHLMAFAKVNGQRFGVSRFDDFENQYLSLTNSLNIDEMLSYVQGMRQYRKTCPASDCSANIPRNISTAINDVLLTQFINTDPKARNALLVFTSGRFDNIDKVREEVGVITRDTGVYVFAVGAGYDSNIDGLQAIAQEASNVFVVTEDNLQTLDVIQSQLSYITCS